MLPIDVFLLVLRLLFIVLIYLFLAQVVITITRDLRRSRNEAPMPATLGHLVLIGSGPTTLAQGTSFTLEARTTIGRGPTNTIRIDDKTISTEHAQLQYHNNMWYVKDVGSSNGTFVNEQPAYNPLPAKMGDIIRIGYMRFQLKP